MVIHQKRIIPKGWLTDQQNKENNYRYMATLENRVKVVFAGDSIIEYFPIDQLINKRALNRGIAGYTSNQLRDNMNSFIMDLNPEVVVLDVGANDCYYRLSDVDTINNIKECVSIAKNRNDSVKIIVCALLPTDNRIDCKNVYFKHINDLIHDGLIGLKGVKIVNVWDRFVGPDGNGKQELYVDGLHPNARGYKIIADEINKLL